MMDSDQYKIRNLIDKVLSQIEERGYSNRSKREYTKLYKRMIQVADQHNIEYYGKEIKDMFLEDAKYNAVLTSKDSIAAKNKEGASERCIAFIESFLETGTVNFNYKKRGSTVTIQNSDFIDAMIQYENYLDQTGLAENTKKNYIRFVRYFFNFLENKNYSTLLDLKPGDILAFTDFATQNIYRAETIGSPYSGLGHLLELYPELRRFKNELIERIPKGKTITDFYTEEEHQRINKVLQTGKLSLRCKAIGYLSFNCGLRAIDIISLTLNSIDWEYDQIIIIQKKTKKPLTIPLTAELGNALYNYILEERPETQSPFVFLSEKAPYSPIKATEVVRKELIDVLNAAKIRSDLRPTGTRIARHSFATRLLRKGNSVDVIKESLGHSSPNSTMRYLSTDMKIIASLTLPLPKGGTAK